MSVITNLNKLVINAASSYIASNSATFKSTVAGPVGLTGATGSQGHQGIAGINGADGEDLTIEQIIYNGDGTFTWHFSDETTYITPNMVGPQGLQGSKGDKGISVHHLKGTSTTNPNGDFGTSPFRDTYTFYGDADETLNLGWFVVTNGISDGMSASVYDTNGNGIVDNSERLGGELHSHYVNVTTDQTVAGNKTFAGNVVVQGDLTVSGNVVSVDVETVTVKDNLIVLNNGEVGTGVTAGEAGIVVDRGTETDYKFVFDEISDSFKVGQEGSLQKVATREDTPVDGGVAIWDTADNRFKTTKNVAVDTVSIGGHTVSWNTDESTLDVALNGAVLQVGQEQLIRVTNNSGTSINDGMAVMATGTLGNSGRIIVAKANLTQANAKFILGVVTETIANGADGFVTAFGKVRGMQTNGVNYGETWVDGDVLYVKDSGNGALTKVVPTDTQVKLPVAIVISAHGSNGTLFVRVNSIDENHAKAELTLKANINSPTLVTPNIGVATGTSFNSITGLASVAPLAAGTAAVGVSTLTARQDHVHPIQTTISGNAGTSTKLATARTIALSGDVSGSTSFDGSGNVTLSAQVIDDSHNHTGLSGTVQFSGSTGNAYSNSNITVNGNGPADTLKPGIGFHQPDLYGGTLSMLDGDTFQFKKIDGQTAATLANNITGNAGTATNLSTDRTTWDTNGTISSTVGQLAWNNYGNNHTIFDASKSLTPTGVAKSNTTPDVPWVPMHPTLMGYNGSLTYGVRVDISARSEACTGNSSTATKLETVRTINSVLFDGTADITVYDSTKAPLASPSLTGVPLAPTAAVGTSTTQLATTAFVVNEINKITEW